MTQITPSEIVVFGEVPVKGAVTKLKLITRIHLEQPNEAPATTTPGMMACVWLGLDHDRPSRRDCDTVESMRSITPECTKLQATTRGIFRILLIEVSAPM